MGNIANGTINTFVDGDVVSANGTAPALLRSALNPKMEVLTAAINDNDSRVAILEGQIASVGSSSVQYNVKAAPFNAVGNGIADDTAAIQAAITAATATAGTVIFPSGSYLVTDTLSVNGSCTLTTDGSGFGALLIQTTNDKAIFNISSSFVSVKNLKFDCVASYSTSTIGVISVTSATGTLFYNSITIDGCEFYSSIPSAQFSSLRINNVNKLVISNCTFTKPASAVLYEASVSLNSCQNTLVYRNLFNAPFSVGRLGGTLIQYPQSLNIYVEQNQFNLYEPFFITSVKNIHILNNVFTTLSSFDTSSYFYAVRIQGSSDGAGGTIYTSSVDIDSNYFDGSAKTAYVMGSLQVLESNYTVIRNNVFYESGLLGEGAVRIDTSFSALISGNQFIQNAFCGVYIAYTSSTIYEPVTITQNVFVDTYSTSAATYAAFISGTGSRTNFTNNIVRRGTKTAPYINQFGIYVGATSNGAFVMSNGNDLSICASGAVYQANPTAICVFCEEPTGDRVFKNSTTTAPSTGTWQRGDKALFDNPSAGGYIGYVCVTAGTPGTWKGYGAIQA